MQQNSSCCCGCAIYSFTATLCIGGKRLVSLAATWTSHTQPVEERRGAGHHQRPSLSKLTTVEPSERNCVSCLRHGLHSVVASWAQNLPARTRSAEPVRPDTGA